MKNLFLVLFLLTISLSTVAQTKDTSKLSGTIYDAKGSVVVDAKITAAGRGKVFTTVSNQEGVYVLTLPFIRYQPSQTFKQISYDISVESPGFKRSETKNYVFIPSQFGKMYFDIALEGIRNDPEHP